MQTWLNQHQQLLSEQIEQNRLPHAILFSGVTGSGKSVLANWLVQVLLCQQLNKGLEQKVLTPCMQCKSCRLYRQGTYPDFLPIVVCS